MKVRSRRTSSLLGRGLLVGIASVLLVTTTATAATTPLKKRLSMTDVSFLGSSGAVSEFEWIAQGGGFFKKQGINATFTVSTALGSDLVATLIGGGAQFETLSVTVTGVAAQAGAPVRALMMSESSTLQQLAISQSAATAHKIPSANSTPAQAKAQFLALKGSHLTIGVGNTTSDGYVWFVSLAQLYGLTIGPKGDVSLSFLGGSTALDAAVNSGKVDAILQTPPVTLAGVGITVPFIVCNLDKLPPANVAADYLVTSINMVQQHRDTVQAVVNGLVAGWHWAKSHRPQAERIVAAQLSANGIADPTEQQEIFNIGLNNANQPYPTKSAFATTARMITGAISPPLTIPYSSFVLPGFVSVAAKDLHITLPKH